MDCLLGSFFWGGVQLRWNFSQKGLTGLIENFLTDIESSEIRMGKFLLFVLVHKIQIKYLGICNFLHWVNFLEEKKWDDDELAHRRRGRKKDHYFVLCSLRVFDKNVVSIISNNNNLIQLPNPRSFLSLYSLSYPNGLSWDPEETARQEKKNIPWYKSLLRKPRRMECAEAKEGFSVSPLSRAQK